MKKVVKSGTTMSYSSSPMSAARYLEDVLLDVETGRWRISNDKVEALYDAVNILYGLSGQDGEYDQVAASKQNDRV